MTAWLHECRLGARNGRDLVSAAVCLPAAGRAPVDTPESIAFHPYPAEIAVAGRGHNLAVAWTGAGASDGAEIRYAEQGPRLATA